MVPFFFFCRKCPDGSILRGGSSIQGEIEFIGAILSLIIYMAGGEHNFRGVGGDSMQVYEHVKIIPSSSKHLQIIYGQGSVVVSGTSFYFDANDNVRSVSDNSLFFHNAER